MWPDLSLRKQPGSTEQGEAVLGLLRPFRAPSVGGSAEQTRFIQQQVLPGHFVGLKRDPLLPNICSPIPIGRTPFCQTSAFSSAAGFQVLVLLGLGLKQEKSCSAAREVEAVAIFGPFISTLLVI